MVQNIPPVLRMVAIKFIQLGIDSAAKAILIRNKD